MEAPEDGAIQLQDVAAGGGSASASYTKDGSDGQRCVASPGGWLGRLSRELHWSFLLAIVSVYGACQGVGDALNGVASGYYWKDVQRVQPSAAQFYQGITGAPWVIKPLWGLLTDVVPVAGYRRRPYLVLAGAIGVTSMLMLSLHRELGIIAAVLALTAQSTGAAIADVTVDALIAQKSITHPPLASDMQSMCGFSSSVGALIGFSISGLLVHSMGSQGVLSLLAIPSALVFSAGILLKESPATDFDYTQVHQKFYKTVQSMGTILKCPEVWRPCLYMYLSFNLSLDIQGGMFYWYTDPVAGPAFSEGFIGLIYSIGSVGSILGVLLYQGALKDYPLRSMFLWSQVLASLAGMLDLVLVARLNLKMGIPDYFFAVIDNSVSQMVGQLIWLPLLVLSSKLCPSGIEGTFYALLMSIQNAGGMMSAWWGGIMLDMLNVTRTEFHNLWIAVLIRNISRLAPLMLPFLVPQSDHDSRLLPVEMLDNIKSSEAVKAGSDSTGFSILVADDSSGLSSNALAQKEKIEEFHAGTADVELIPLVNKSRPNVDS
ncbi:hypothetical protein HU200_032422 [Digitaria exilis]|uniref:Folate-biopterin transporter 2 n=1 Tax=Digitaria exilis TaxID=1010633 RepID=A0A835ESL6_9POAL|nr:hypothetical protein HU200_032422 [Digitaria exilis]CAB3487530.1 unnamed protein product [Digitaria exilis]